ncbi:MAG: phospho-sugar mutase [Ruminococcaceae bacterium]|nr:phospho-sugar mutase [Oscillospiraceae bacterium]
MNYKELYQLWLEKADEDTKKELLAISDEKEIEDRFYQTLEFGTGGLRGVMGAGTNRMNLYVIRWATQGIADYINTKGAEAKQRGVVIAHDSRNHSREFAEETAKVLAANGIHVSLFDSLRPTPMLSFAVRHLGAFAGVVVTASHNPKEYNGYKVYFEDGGQLPLHVSDMIIQYIDKVDMFSVPTTDLDNSLIELIGKEVDEAYLENVAKQSVHPELDKTGYKLVYTPLHGSGNLPVRAILKRTGFSDVILVPEQVEPDGNFPTVASPNPENKECFTRAIELAKENQCDLIIGTDPDSDRVGIVVRSTSGEYVTMTGNQVGALLANYILTEKKNSGQLPANGAIVSTIVTTGILKEISKAFGVTYFDVLTGFKYIGEMIYKFETEHSHTYLLGLEESYGYLVGTYARDKDAVVASMLIAEMGVFYSKQGKTLYDVMQELYKTYGYHYEETISITLKGKDGAEKIKALTAGLRNNPPAEFGGYKVVALDDYLTGEHTENGVKTTLTLPKSDVLRFHFENGATFVVRPSGTEPKIKLYYLMKGKDEASTKEMFQKVKAAAEAIINS